MLSCTHSSGKLDPSSPSILPYPFIMWCMTSHQHPLTSSLPLSPVALGQREHQHLQDLWFGSPHSSHNSPGLTEPRLLPLTLQLPVAILGDKTAWGNFWGASLPKSLASIFQTVVRETRISLTLLREAVCHKPGLWSHTSHRTVRWIIFTYITGMWSVTTAGGFCNRGTWWATL